MILRRLQRFLKMPKISEKIRAESKGATYFFPIKVQPRDPFCLFALEFKGRKTKRPSGIQMFRTVAEKMTLELNWKKFPFRGEFISIKIGCKKGSAKKKEDLGV